MSRDKNLTESRLNEALERLLKGLQCHVKAKGKLTLNKINNEALLGNSYIHKFPDFVAYAKPLIHEYNLNRDSFVSTGLDVDMKESFSEIDQLKFELARERKLKDKYRLERDNAIEARKQLDELHSTLMFRVYELQDELQGYKLVVTPFNR